MSASSGRERQLVEYLLGGLPPEERERTEERLFIEEDLHEELEATGDDLIHAYLAGTLPQVDRERFETHFLASPRRRQRLEFMRGLMVAVNRVSADAPVARPRERYVWRPWMLPAAAALVLATILAFLVRTSPQQTQHTSLSPEPLVSPSLPPGPQESPAPPRPKAPSVSVTRLARGHGPASVAVTAETRWVRLEVPVTEDRPSYDAVLRAADGTEVWRAEGLAPSKAGDPLFVTVAAEVFRADAYTLVVEGEALRGEPRQEPPRVAFPLRIVRDR